MVRNTVFLAVLSLTLAAGCAVPQPRGAGKLDRIVEPTTSRGYWRYLPKDYVTVAEDQRRSRRWPLVVTFHGMKPFDNAYPQACEWQQEADRYGYVVIAPELGAPDVLQQFPVRTIHPEFRRDEECTLAILDHIFATTQADPSHVLSTSWSSGGYMAHYMLNRHPDRFTCLAVRQSNFSNSVLDATAAARSLYHPILIVNTQNDFAICVSESKHAREWYQQHQYKNFAWIIIKNLGHERTPDLAADFFSRFADVQPNSQPSVLVKRQAIDGNAEGLAVFARTPHTFAAPLRTAGVSPPPTTIGRSATPPRPTEPDPVLVRRTPDSEAVATGPLTPDRASAIPTRSTPKRSLVSIRVSSAIGLQPLMLSFWAEAPVGWPESASFQWTLDGATIGNGVNGQKTLPEAGEYTLGLLVVTADGTEHRTARSIRVLPRLGSASSAGY